eukprot:scaffold12726_cov148-Cylindrotheca_fusiformis.AAC.3
MSTHLGGSGEWHEDNATDEERDRGQKEPPRKRKWSRGAGNRLKQARKEQDLSNQCVDSSWRQESGDHEYSVEWHEDGNAKASIDEVD